MISKLEIEAIRKQSELGAVQLLKQRGEINVMKSARYCQKIYGKQWFADAVQSGLITGVPQGARVLFSIEQILALQLAQLMEAEKMISTFKK